jgi:hypothetical protein
VLSDVQTNDSSHVHVGHARAGRNCGPYILVYIREGWIDAFSKSGGHVVKFIVGLLLVAAVVIFSGQLPARAEGQFLKLSKIPGNCKDGKASPEAKSWFGIDTLGIESEEQAATASIELARSELSLYQQNRDASYLLRSKAHMREALAQLQKNLDERFEMADAALSAGCFSLADDGYRDVIKTHTGADYQAARDRAKVGIDDVRAKQPR